MGEGDGLGVSEGIETEVAVSVGSRTGVLVGEGACVGTIVAVSVGGIEGVAVGFKSGVPVCVGVTGGAVVEVAAGFVVGEDIWVQDGVCVMKTSKVGLGVIVNVGVSVIGEGVPVGGEHW